MYGNQAAVDDELIDLIYQPSTDEGALDAFVSIMTGEAGGAGVRRSVTLVSVRTWCIRWLCPIAVPHPSCTLPHLSSLTRPDLT